MSTEKLRAGDAQEQIVPRVPDSADHHLEQAKILKQSGNSAAARKHHISYLEMTQPSPGWTALSEKDKTYQIQLLELRQSDAHLRTSSMHFRSRSRQCIALALVFEDQTLTLSPACGPCNPDPISTMIFPEIDSNSLAARSREWRGRDRVVHTPLGRRVPSCCT